MDRMKRGQRQEGQELTNTFSKVKYILVAHF